MDKMFDYTRFDETKQLLVDLAIHFTQKTKIVVVPRGTWTYLVEQLDQPPLFDDGNDKLTITKIFIQIYPFFGMRIGYNSKLDILVIWEY